ncbi:hypothetical protein MPLSOD_140548 [Mesorhizobium sp. SOD10]|nr:hypothetical protein MPLSOD_140548 [Mesorhizobium sp. SOD10]
MPKIGTTTNFHGKAWPLPLNLMATSIARLRAGLVDRFEGMLARERRIIPPAVQDGRRSRVARDEVIR